MTTEFDVSVERTIAAPAERVAAVMFDPAQDLTWMKALTGAQLLDAPLAPGSRVHRTAQFLGRSIGWTTVVREYTPSSRLVLDITNGPFVGVVTYEIEPAGAGARVRIRNVGTPGKFKWMPARLMRRAMRTSVAKDLANLEQLVTS